MKRLVDLVVALRIAALDQRAQLLVHCPSSARRSAPVMRSAAKPAQSASSSAIASNMPARRCARRPRHQRGAVRARLDQPAGRELPDRLAHRRARDLEAARELRLVERRAGRERAAHDLVGKLQPQLLGQRLARPAKRSAASGATSGDLADL